jgi:hypothetical protein
MGEAYSMHGKMKNATKTQIEEPKGKVPHLIPRRRWKDNIKINL